jgi:hypothetical protein
MEGAGISWAQVQAVLPKLEARVRDPTTRALPNAVRAKGRDVIHARIAGLLEKGNSTARVNGNLSSSSAS